jgi:16S rRNA (guanine966-N2)-methyltransferase
LQVPAGARPTTGKTREALFSMVQGWVAGGVVLDVFAGSGVVGLEALSRGASRVVAVEQDRRAAATIRGNADALGCGVEFRLMPEPAAVALVRLARAGELFDLVYADPPYADRSIGELLAPIAAVVAPDGRLVVERSSRDPALDRENLEAAGLVSLDRRRYGETSLEVVARAAVRR